MSKLCCCFHESYCFASELHFVAVDVSVHPDISGLLEIKPQAALSMTLLQVLHACAEKMYHQQCTEKSPALPESCTSKGIKAFDICCGDCRHHMWSLSCKLSTRMLEAYQAHQI